MKEVPQCFYTKLNVLKMSKTVSVSIKAARPSDPTLQNIPMFFGHLNLTLSFVGSQYENPQFFLKPSFQGSTGK